MKQEPGKRIVSKAEYAKAQTRRVLKGSTGIYLGCIGIACVLLLIVSIYYAYPFFFQSGNLDIYQIPFLALFLIVSASLVGTAHLTIREATRIIKAAVNTNPGIPFTRANTTNLPASDCLVRASQEPMQAQQSVLLRAATETTQEQEKQLLRALAGGKK